MNINETKSQIIRANNNNDLTKIKHTIVSALEKNKKDSNLKDLLKCVNDKIQPHLPKTLLKIQEFLKTSQIKCIQNKVNDGRTNSCLDENMIINTIMTNPDFVNIVKKPEKRFWYDLTVIDPEFGVIPVNIKTTTLKTADNVGNMSLCLQSFTDVSMNFEQSYNNGTASQLFLKKLKAKQLNTDFRKDYFFLVVNKDIPNDIIVNSLLGISTINPNVNNLPFQIRWKDNREYSLSSVDDVESKIKQFVDIMQKKAIKTWQEKFLYEFRDLKI
jgi:hypothetical protein